VIRALLHSITLAVVSCDCFQNGLDASAPVRHDELNAPNILALLRANYVVHFTKVYDIFSEKGAMKVCSFVCHM